MVERRNAVVGVSAVALIALLVVFVLPAFGIEFFPFGKARVIVNVRVDCGFAIPLIPNCWFTEQTTTVSINKYIFGTSILRGLSTLSVFDQAAIEHNAIPGAILYSCGWLGGGLSTVAKFSVTETGYYAEKTMQLCQGDNIANFYFPVQSGCYNWKLQVSDVIKTGKWCMT